MASIQEVTEAKGAKTFIVHYQQLETGHGRQRSFDGFDEAVSFFYECETAAAGWINAGSAEYCSRWTLQKLIWFFLGYRCVKLRTTDALTYRSYVKSRYDLQAIQGDILERKLPDITPRQLELSVLPAGLTWLRSAFHQLRQRELFPFNPVPKRRPKRRQPLEIPSKATVKKMQTEPPARERVAIWLGAICGLRICEVLALDGCDITRDNIQINKHMVRGGVIVPGMKRGEQRQVRTPKELYQLIDHHFPGVLGTRRPLFTSHYTGARIGLGYSNQGELKRTLNQYGIRRFHHLRHFAVSRLAARGIDIIRVSKMIGHSDPSITMDVYGHLFGESIDLDFD